MIPENIRAVPIEMQKKTGMETRYIIVDIETGEILDDAYGYGYKLEINAYKSYSYKLNQAQING